MQDIEENIEKKEYDSWSELMSDYQKDFTPEGQWMFRGQANADWPLKSKLERELEKYQLPMTEAEKYEFQILREFSRKIGSYRSDFVPKDSVECISFIQHFGGPTRLLDWTYSFYVAAFFAFAEAGPDSNVAIWCFRSASWDEAKAKDRFFGKKTLHAFKNDPTFKATSTHEQVFGFPRIISTGEIEKQKPVSKPCVFMLSSRFLNNRIIKQQGVFLAQTDLTKSFNDNLQTMLQDEHFKGAMRKLTIQCNKKLLKDVLYDLRRMTLTYENLFDDINYFCKSLAMGIVNLYGYLTDTSGIKLIDKKKI